METIADLLPNEHILNFHDEDPVIPDWIGPNLRLMIGAGDLDHDNMPNVQKFSTYDVFLCLPWSTHALRQNVEHLLSNFEKKKIICFLDATNSQHILSFTELFAGRFSLIDGHGGHCPHLELSQLQRLLTEGGQAMNIFEYGDTVISVDELTDWLDNGHSLSANMLTCRVYHDDPTLKTRMIEKTRALASAATYIRICPQLLFSLEILTLREIQYVCRALTYDTSIPINLSGLVLHNEKDWRNPCMELVLTKKMPDFKMDVLTRYIEQNGETAQSFRALYIIDKIREDLKNGCLFDRYKYKTLLKHINTMEQQ